MKDEDDLLIAYSIGIVSASVCVKKGLSKNTIERLMNEKHPTEIRSKWVVSSDKTFVTGETNPCQCEGVPDREHYLMNC